MGNIPKHAQLESMTDEDLIARYDAAAMHTVVGTGFYRDELARRQSARDSAQMLGLTRNIGRLTWVILALTAANAVLVAVQVLGLR